LIVIPAIDLKGGKCVRLRQGKMSDETVFSNVPEEMAVRWFEQGAERLHLVDLDGAIRGKPINRDAIKRIVNSVPIPIELGGGIRDMKTLEAYFDLGLHFLILGTAAYKDPEFAKEACKEFAGRIIVGIDAKEERVALEGWTETIEMTPVAMAKGFEGEGVAAIIYTDILRDGMRTGPNVEATRALARSIDIPVIASGGISGLEDVKNVQVLSADGVQGMITGRALYDGSLSLKEAINACITEKKN
jgi:phosphoribosylformimino-5-aminoimidazole carboxamide ribotide isomerase